MSEEKETQVAATETSEQETPVTKPSDTVEFWKQKAREQETRAKANATAATRLAELEAANQTEAQRLEARATAAEQRAQELESHALRLEVAAEKGLTQAQAKRLVGTTREELESDAVDLLETFKPAAEEERESVATSLDLGSRAQGTSGPETPAASFTKFLQRLS